MELKAETLQAIRDYQAAYREWLPHASRDFIEGLWPVLALAEEKMLEAIRGEA